MNKDYIMEEIIKQVDDNHFIQYYHSNCIGDTITTFTLFEGDICVPEYSKEELAFMVMEKARKIDELENINNKLSNALESAEDRIDIGVEYLKQHTNDTHEYLDVWEVKDLLNILEKGMIK